MKNKPEFQLAVTIFIGISIIGTIFGLWWASHYAGMQPRTNTNPVQEGAAPPPEEHTPPSANRDAQ